MSNLIFYEHMRMDGGLRCGLELDGETVLHRFKKGKGEFDPVLRWFVDVRCQGAKLPDAAEAARQWFLQHADTVHGALRQLAEELRAGMEPDVWPLSWPVPKSPRGVKMVIACSVTKRLDGLEISRILEDVDKHWEEHLKELTTPEPVTS
jgi:hypothetical protein